MKMPVLFLLILLLLCLGSCENGNENNPTPVSGRLIHVSDCKINASFLTPTTPTTPTTITTSSTPSSSCIQYTYDKQTSRLTLHHINAAFNCCPDTITCEVKQNGSTIEILEKEASALCNCSCLYDLDMVIDGLFEIRYLIRLTEPYAGSQEPLIFTIDLKQKPSGEVCVARDGYPWGI